MLKRKGVCFYSKERRKHTKLNIVLETDNAARTGRILFQSHLTNLPITHPLHNGPKGIPLFSMTLLRLVSARLRRGSCPSPIYCERCNLVQVDEDFVVVFTCQLYRFHSTCFWGKCNTFMNM